MQKLIYSLFFGWAASAAAVVVQDYATATNPPAGMNWNFVYSYKGSSSVAVGGGWLLTAAHVADDGGDGSVTVDGVIYQQQEIVYNPSADLALVRFNQIFPGHYPVYAGNVLPPANDPLRRVVVVGYGTVGSTYPFHWTDNGTGRGVKRWGSQEIDRTATRIYDVGGVSKVSRGFWMDFDLANTAHEAGSGAGDSGGGVFYDDGSGWKLTGIKTERSLIGGEYTATFAVSMPEYADWVAETIPEPVTSGLLGFSSFGLILARARLRKGIRVKEKEGNLFLQEEADVEKAKPVRADVMTGL